VTLSYPSQHLHICSSRRCSLYCPVKEPKSNSKSTLKHPLKNPSTTTLTENLTSIMIQFFLNCIWSSLSKNKNKNYIFINNKKYKVLFTIFKYKNFKKNNFVDIFACFFRFNSWFMKSLRICSTFQKYYENLFCLS